MNAWIMKSVLFSFLLVFLIGCSVTNKITEKNLIGRYYWKGAPELRADLELAKDSTYSYDIQSGFMERTSTGIWTVNNGGILINSFRKPEDTLIKYILLSKSIANKDSITFKVVDENNTVLQIFELRLFKNKKFVADTRDKSSKEKFSIPGIDFDSLYIWAGPEYYAIQYKTTDNSNCFSFKLKEGLSNYQFYTNKKLRIKGDKIIDTDRKKIKYLRYHPVHNANNKQSTSL
jgi:hypothetical protein